MSRSILSDLRDRDCSSNAGLSAKRPMHAPGFDIERIHEPGVGPDIDATACDGGLAVSGSSTPKTKSPLELQGWNVTRPDPGVWLVSRIPKIRTPAVPPRPSHWICETGSFTSIWHVYGITQIGGAEYAAGEVLGNGTLLFWTEPSGNRRHRASRQCVENRLGSALANRRARRCAADRRLFTVARRTLLFEQCDGSAALRHCRLQIAKGARHDSSCGDHALLESTVHGLGHGAQTKSALAGLPQSSPVRRRGDVPVAVDI